MGNSTGKTYAIGIDLGGTKIMAGLYNQAMECVTFSRKPTKAQKGPETVVDRIVECIQEVMEQEKIGLDQVEGIGIGAPGSVHPKSGTVIFAPNLEWKKVPLVDMLRKQIKVPYYLENDCNICTLGVQAVELKGKPRHLVGIFVGTGIGSGLIVNGELYSGFNNTAGEIGHMVIDIQGPKCGCGNKGCLEALASRNAIFKRIIDGIKKGEKTIIEELLGEDLKDQRSAKLRKAIARGDKFVEKIVEEASYHIGIAVANVINLVNPEFVVLGGGVIHQMEDLMMGIIADAAKKHAMPGTFNGVSIQPSKLADDAGIVGGASLVRLRQKATA